MRERGKWLSLTALLLVADATGPPRDGRGEGTRRSPLPPSLWRLRMVVGAASGLYFVMAAKAATQAVVGSLDGAVVRNRCSTGASRNTAFFAACLGGRLRGHDGRGVGSIGLARHGTCTEQTSAPRSVGREGCRLG